MYIYVSLPSFQETRHALPSDGSGGVPSHDSRQHVHIFVVIAAQKSAKCGVRDGWIVCLHQRQLVGGRASSAGASHCSAPRQAKATLSSGDLEDRQAHGDVHLVICNCSSTCTLPEAMPCSCTQVSAVPQCSGNRYSATVKHLPPHFSSYKKKYCRLQG